MLPGRGRINAAHTLLLPSDTLLWPSKIGVSVLVKGIPIPQENPLLVNFRIDSGTRNLAENVLQAEVNESETLAVAHQILDADILRTWYKNTTENSESIWDQSMEQIPPSRQVIQTRTHYTNNISIC